MELWDAYDEHFNRVNTAYLIRGEAIPDGLFHLVCDILVKQIDGTYLIMQRDYEKHLGGMWEASAGGSALRGETPIECARRELFEETGIASGTFERLGTVTDAAHQSIYFEYLCTTGMDKAGIKLQRGETIAYRWVRLDELLSMGKQELATTRMLNYIK